MNVDISCTPVLGGAFGGKELRTFLLTIPTALAAQR